MNIIKNLFNYNTPQGILNIVLTIVAILFLLHLFNKNILEHMSETTPVPIATDEQVHNAVKEIYDMDVASIRNLSDVASKLTNPEDGSVTIPGNLVVKGKIDVQTVEGNTDSGNINASNITVNDLGTFTRVNINNPQGTTHFNHNNSGVNYIRGTGNLTLGASNKPVSLYATGGAQVIGTIISGDIEATGNIKATGDTGNIIATGKIYSI